MNKRILFILLLIAAFVLPANAVLKEDSLANSLAVLRHELISYHVQQNKLLSNSKAMSQEVFETMRNIMERSSQNAIMLYSQQTDNIFELTYACHEAKAQYEEFRKKTLPFKEYIANSNLEISRYDSLVNALSTMPVFILNDRAKVDRNVCLTLAVNIRRMLIDNNEDMKEYVMYYQFTEKRLSTLNSYADSQYEFIQQSIFSGGSPNYYSILRNLKAYLTRMSISLSQQYNPDNKVMSQWDVRWIIWLFVAIAMYALLAVAVNLFSIRFVVTRLMRRDRFKDSNKWFLEKRSYIILAGSIITFGVIMAIFKTGMLTSSNFVKMSASMLLELSWLGAAIVISILLRVSGIAIKYTYRVYSPIIAVAFVVFAFRIVLIPTVILNLFFPPILILTTAWQFHVGRKYHTHLLRSDMILSTATLTVLIASFIASVTGYTLLAVQLIIWWLMMLTCILTIACIKKWLSVYRVKHDIMNQPVTKAWWFRLIYFVLIPSLSVYSFIIAIYWAASVFNLNDTIWKIFSTYFIDTKNFRLSIFAIVQVIILTFVFNYLNYTLKDLIRLYLQQKDVSTAISRSVMIIKVQQVIVWGAWLLIALAIFHVSNTWLVVVSGGLSTGIGFAMKDILENIYYGISLMAGRIKVGDYIICDGIRGKVSSISYTSTMLEGIDGSVIAFTNSQLFTKNYKNLTKNHGLELDVLEVGVAYGTNIQQCQKLLIDAITKLDCIDHRRGVKVVLKSFDDNCVTLKILVWVNVLTQYGDDGKIMECIYKTLNDNNIEIPFPQRDVHIINSNENNTTINK
ncbi:mechanosensitive ion channel domain-containing protein [uncultured Prevotella sp.]|uniref:mechanosensitive ion channel family protein n=1 Tax=uncultured Prevotella sp. TaxID=159272 RepID=UPI00258AE0EF|nr:mechanosensitive ion channel domain-containing protein [uncultured Prevotella sp.]